MKFFDYDHDGDQDLILTNGHPDDLIEQISNTLTHKEPLLLFENAGKGFHLVGSESRVKLLLEVTQARPGIGDLDNDGHSDVVVANNGEAPLLFATRVASNRWLGLRLVGSTANREAIGATISWSVGGIKRSLLKTSGGSYLSSHDSREVLGLGPAEKADSLEVRWPAPSQRIDRFENIAANRYYTLREGKPLVAN